MSPATFRPGAVFLLQTQAVLSWATHVDGRYAALLFRYSHASASLPVAVFSALRFSRIPAAQALCADVDNSSTKCGDYATGVEASRQLSGSFSYGIREEYDTPAWSDITPAVEALR
jgi:hypothetical protein